MKLNGKTLTAPKPKHAVIVREEGNHVFVCGPVLDYVRFEQICPEPTAPIVAPVGKPPYKDLTDRKYLAKIEARAEAKVNWIYLQSLSHTPGLEWETVVENDPTTWGNWEKELKGLLTEQEIMTIKVAVTEANMTSEETQRAALDAFFRQAEAASQDHRLLEKAEAASTVSGEPASV